MFKLPFIKKQTADSVHPVALIILDGFGIAPPSEGNAVTLAKLPYYNRISQEYPHTELIASGESVGLPANEVGNTEVGHLTMGTGRVIFQDLKRINVAIEKGHFYNNRALLQAVGHVKRNNSVFHVMGLASSGNVHSSLPHLFAIIDFCKREEVQKVALHLFTDGRDAAPDDGINIIKQVLGKIKTDHNISISTISGRYYAMDRDKRWDRTEKAYKAIVLGRGPSSSDVLKSIEESYAAGKTDEFIEPTVILKDEKPLTVNDNDAVMFFNFRIDRPKQLAMPFVLPEFEKLREFDFGYDPAISRDQGVVEIGTPFKREKVLQNLFFVTMTEYQKGLPVSAVAFGPEEVPNTLATVISQSGAAQLHMSESEKQRFVTYYFDGMRDDPIPGEEAIIIPSPKVATYDKKPEMSLPKLAKEFIRQVRKNKYKFIVVNIANPDMVAHSGNLPATIKAVQYVDQYLSDMCEEILRWNGTVCLTADHGNAEELITYPTTSFFFTSKVGSTNTDHSNNPVPFIVIHQSLQGRAVSLNKGSLSDVAPTILAILDLKQPAEMTGRNLLSP